MKKNSALNRNQQTPLLSDFLCILLLVITPFIYFLTFNDYGVLKIESIIILSILITSGAMVFYIYHKMSGSKLQHGSDILFASIFTLSLSFLPGFQSGWILVSSWLLSLLAIIFLKQQFTQLLVIMLAVFVLGILFLPMPKQLSHATLSENASSKALHATSSALPPIIHVILDEHIGIEGLPSNIGQGDALKKQLKAFYITNGFEIYGNAYSHYVHTYNSLPNLLNFTTRAQDSYYFKPDDPDRILRENAYFDALQEMGYQIRVYQADYINFCQSTKQPLAACYTYPAASVTSIQSLSLPLYERILFLLKSFVITSSLYDKGLVFYHYDLQPAAENFNLELPKGRWYQARTCNIPIIPVVSKLITDIKQSSTGTVFFAHLLIPHNPYIYNDACEIDPKASQWRIDVGPLPLANDAHSRATRYALYENQLRCSQKLVQRIFAALKEADIYDKAIIIVQGDHGSRIMLAAPSSENKSRLTSDQINDAYSTLFAVKMPNKNNSGAYKLEQKPIEQLLKEATLAATAKNADRPQTLVATLNSDSSLDKPYVFLVPQQPGAVMETYLIPKL